MWLTRDNHTLPATAADLTPGSIADILGDGWGIKIDRIETTTRGLRIHSDHSSRVIKTGAPVRLFARDERGRLIPSQAAIERRATRTARFAAQS